MNQNNEQQKARNPKEKAGILSLTTFFYTFELFKKGYKKDLEEDDIYRTMPNYRSGKLGDKLEAKWNIENGLHTSPSIYRTLWACYGKLYLLLGFIQLCMKLFVAIALPEALGKLIAYFTKDQTEVSKDDACYYGTVVVALIFVNAIYLHNYMLIVTEMAIRIKAAFCSLIYRKSLKLTPSALSEITMGKIVTLIAKDVYSFDSAVIFANDIWIGFVKIFVMSYVMYSKIGLAAFAGIGFLLLIIPLQIYVGKWTAQLRLKASIITDTRLQTTQETLSAIKIIKMYTWEKLFKEKISTTRRQEVSKIRNIYYMKAVSLMIGGLITQISFYLLVMTYIWLGNNLTAEVVYFLMGCLHTLRSTVTISIPLGIAQLAELTASVKRVNKVLIAEELRKPHRISGNISKPLINLKNVTVKIKDKQILHNIHLDIKSGLNLVTGPVGSGKTSLLKTILEDFTISQGSLEVFGSISYASQEPWLFPSSVKQNIIFGEKYNEIRYQKVLEVCALKLDISTFQLGDETLVGDHGLNLSKGQQARINLARAVYKDSDIYLLDDSLSALDIHIQKYVFQECIVGFLKDKIRMLVSHNKNHTSEADKTFAMNNGTNTVFVMSNETTDTNFHVIDENTEFIDHENGEKKAIDTFEMDNEEMGDDTNFIDKLPAKEGALPRNIYHENKKSGKVDIAVYKKFIKFGGGIYFLTFLLGLFAVAQFTHSYTDKLVSSWVNLEQTMSAFRANASTNTTECQFVDEKRSRTLTLYTIMTISSTILIFIRAYVHFSFASTASVNLHKSMVANIIEATMQFFDNNFIGNILNRFSKDLGTIDEYLPFVMYECLRIICLLVGIILLITIVNVTFLLPTVIFFIILFFILKFYLPTGRSLKRLESATRSPMIGYLNASLEGLTTIRAYGAQPILLNEFDKHQDLYTSALHMLQCSNRAFGFLLDMLSSVFITIIVMRFVMVDLDTEAGDVGLAVTQAFMLTGLLQWGIRQWAELENQMTSVERVIEYTELKKERKTGQIVENWPGRGGIIYKNVNLSYNAQELVLKNINFIIHPGEKVGIVGRTGAGKSSIISILLRLYEIQGVILIDDIDIRTLPLDFLRSNIAIIPQDPVLFTGTIRANIDPCGKFADDQIWKTIDTVKLKDLIKDLNQKITECGTNLSSGQRQLICLARAIISRNKIIVVDEATANMDPEIDSLIHKTIQDNFAECTVITIAHRLHSVLNSDKVMVVDNGEIVEFGHPQNLIKQNGAFCKMITHANLLNDKQN